MITLYNSINARVQNNACILAQMVYYVRHSDIELIVSYFTLCQGNRTPLYLASKNGHHDIVQSLLGSGADVNKLRMPSVSDVVLLPMV